MTDHAEFDPNDPFDLACEVVRTEILVAIIRATEGPVLGRLASQQHRIEAVMAGGVVALSCALLSFVDRADLQAVAVMRELLLTHASDWFDYAALIEPGHGAEAVQ